MVLAHGGFVAVRGEFPGDSADHAGADAAAFRVVLKRRFHDSLLHEGEGRGAVHRGSVSELHLVLCLKKRAVCAGRYGRGARGSHNAGPGPFLLFIEFCLQIRGGELLSVLPALPVRHHEMAGIGNAAEAHGLRPGVIKAGEKVFIEEVLLKHDAEHAHGQGAVLAGDDGQPLIRVAGGVRGPGVNDHELQFAGRVPFSHKRAVEVDAGLQGLVHIGPEDEHVLAGHDVGLELNILAVSEHKVPHAGAESADIRVADAVDRAHGVLHETVGKILVAGLIAAADEDEAVAPGPERGIGGINGIVGKHAPEAWIYGCVADAGEEFSAVSHFADELFPRYGPESARTAGPRPLKRLQDADGVVTVMHGFLCLAAGRRGHGKGFFCRSIIGEGPARHVVGVVGIAGHVVEPAVLHKTAHAAARVAAEAGAGDASGGLFRSLFRLSGSGRGFSGAREERDRGQGRAAEKMAAVQSKSGFFHANFSPPASGTYSVLNAPFSPLPGFVSPASAERGRRRLRVCQRRRKASPRRRRLPRRRERCAPRPDSIRI